MKVSLLFCVKYSLTNDTRKLHFALCEAPLTEFKEFINNPLNRHASGFRHWICRLDLDRLHFITVCQCCMVIHCLFFFKTVNQIKWRHTTKESISIGCIPPACQTIRALVTTTRCQWRGWVLRWTSLNRSTVMTNRCHYCLPVSARGGGVCPGGVCPVHAGIQYLWADTAPPPTPREQIDWQTSVKTLPVRNFVCGR